MARHARLQAALNLGIAATATACAILGAQHLLARRPLRTGDQSVPLRIGEAFALNGRRPSQARTLFIALREGCSFYSASSQFYTLLLRRASVNGVLVIAMLPDSATDVHYPERLGLRGVKVVRANFGAIGIAGVPTILYVGHGQIQDAWLGLLDRPHQEQVVSIIEGQRQWEGMGPYGGDLISALDVRSLLALDRPVTILDTRTRGEFAAGHVPGAINIPLDELPSRAPNEIDLAREVVVYCPECGQCRQQGASEATYEQLCAVARQYLRDAGFQRVKVLRGGLRAWAEAGGRTTR